MYISLKQLGVMSNKIKHKINHVQSLSLSLFVYVIMMPLIILFVILPSDRETFLSLWFQIIQYLETVSLLIQSEFRHFLQYNKG